MAKPLRDRPPVGLASLSEAAGRRPRLALLLLCLLLWLPGFFSIPATDRDEARFAQASRQMVETGDYVHIRLGAEERNKKPAGIYWLQAAAVHALEATGLGGRGDIWAYRLASLLGALLAVQACFHWGRTLVGRRPACLAAALLAAAMVVVAEVHIAKTDAALLACVTAAMGLFGQAYLRPGHFSARQAAGFWLLLGGAALLKGPVGPMVPLLAGITLAIADRGAPWFRALRPGWGVPLMILAAAPWFIAIGIATEGRFFQQSVGGDMLAKIGSGEEKHGGPPGLYLGTFGITAFPGAFLVLLALPAIWRERTLPRTRFLLAWVVPSWLVFEAVPTKLPHYVLPLFPALFLLGAAWAMDPLRWMPPRWWRGFALFVLIAVAVGLAILGNLAGFLLLPFPPLAGLLALPAAAVLAWAVLRAIGNGRGDWGQAGFYAAILAIPLYAAVLEGIAPRLSPIWIAPRIATLLAAQAPGLPARDFGITSHAEPSVLFAIGGEAKLLPTGGAAAEFLGAGPGRVVAVGDRALGDFQAMAAALGFVPQPLGELSGLNYTRGRWITLRFFRQG